MINNKLIGHRIKQLRKDHRLAQVPFAKESGISQAALCKIEQGKGISVEALVNISLTFDKNIYWLLGINSVNLEEENVSLKKRIKLLDQIIAEQEKLLKLKK